MRAQPSQHARALSAGLDPGLAPEGPGECGLSADIACGEGIAG
jgi:hypothetical protein